MITYSPINLAYIKDGVLHEPFIIKVHENLKNQTSVTSDVLEWLLKRMRVSTDTGIHMFHDIVMDYIEELSGPSFTATVSDVKIVKRMIGENSIVLRGFTIYPDFELNPAIEIIESVYKDARNVFAPAVYHKNNKVIGI